MLKILSDRHQKANYWRFATSSCVTSKLVWQSNTNFPGWYATFFWREKNRHITVKLLGILIDLAKPRREGSDNCHYRKQTLSPTNHSRRSAFASVPKVSAIGPKQTCQKTQSMSLLGVKRTCGRKALYHISVDFPVQ